MTTTWSRPPAFAWRRPRSARSMSERRSSCAVSTASPTDAVRCTGGDPSVSGVDVARVLDTMRHDKKAQGGKTTMVLPTRINLDLEIGDLLRKMVPPACS